MDFRDSVFNSVNFSFDVYSHHHMSDSDYISDTANFNHQHSTFEEAKFENIVFKDFANFNNVEFKKSIKFNECIFAGITTFDNAKFMDKPNFLNCTFANQLNIFHENLEYDFEYINKNFKNDIASYRDLFRRFKSNRLAFHNQLDAGNLHKQELYAKEIELENSHKILKDKVDLCTLKFYRVLSDHHTDLLKVFNNLVILIALFFISTFEIIDSKNLLFNYAYKSGENFSIFEYKIENQDKDFNTLVLRNKQTNLQNPLRNKIKNLVDFCIDNFLILLLVFLNVFPVILYVLSMLFILINKNIKMFNMIFVISYILLIYYINIYNFNLNFSITGLINLFFIASYIILINLNKTIILIFSYLVLFLIIGSGKLIFLAPILGKLTTDFNPENKLFISLSFTYTLLMFLVLFSLQKTARRNSIVPS